MPTVQDCIDGLHVTYPQVQDAQALLYFQQIHREVCNLAQIDLQEENINLTDGTRMYALSDAASAASPSITTVRAAYYKKSATEVNKLLPSSSDWMDNSRLNWRTANIQVDSGTATSTTSNKLESDGHYFETTVSVGDTVQNTTDDTSALVTNVDSNTILSLDTDIMTSGELFTIIGKITGQPTRFFLESVDTTSGTKDSEVQIGLEPIPDTTTSSGYPILALYGSSYQALLVTDQIPPIIASIRVYIEGMKKLYASDRDPERFGLWEELFRHELHSTLAYTNSTIEDLDSPRFIPRWMKNSKIQ